MPKIEKRYTSVVALRDIVLKYNAHKLRYVLRTIKNIFNPNHKVYYSDLTKIPKITTWEAIRDFVVDTIAHIVNNGKSIFVTKNCVNGETVYGIATTGGWKKYDFYVDDMAKGLKPGVPITLYDVVYQVVNDISYSRIEFIPNLDFDNSENVFNRYTGLICEHDFDLGSGVKYSPLVPIIYHIKNVICDGNSLSYKYFMNWLAHIVYYPDDEIGKSILIKSVEGNEEMAFWHWIGASVLGNKYYVHVNAGKVTKKITNIIKNVLLTVFEDTSNKKSGTSYSTLKQLITDAYRPFGLKRDLYRTKNWSNYVIISNDEQFVSGVPPAALVCFNTSNKYADDWAYWKTLRASYTADNGRLLYEVLSLVDLGSWDKEDIPPTELNTSL